MGEGSVEGWAGDDLGRAHGATAVDALASAVLAQKEARFRGHWPWFSGTSTKSKGERQTVLSVVDPLERRDEGLLHAEHGVGGEVGIVADEGVGHDLLVALGASPGSACGRGGRDGAPDGAASGRPGRHPGSGRRRA